MGVDEARSRFVRGRAFLWLGLVFPLAIVYSGPYPNARNPMTAHPTTFNDTPFRFSHGRSPKGRGSWAFQMRAVDNVSVPDGFRDVVFFNGTFADARRQARDFFPRGASVSVMS